LNTLKLPVLIVCGDADETLLILAADVMEQAV